MNVDWSQFRDGDSITVTLSGTWRVGCDDSASGVDIQHGERMHRLFLGGVLGAADGAEREESGSGAT